MNPRERLLAMIVLGAIVAGGLGFMAYEFIMVPLEERQVALGKLQDSVDEQQNRINEVLALRPKLEMWRRLSLPADVDLSRREYVRYLNELLQKSGFAAGVSIITPKPPDTRTGPTLGAAKKDPVYTRLVFTVQTHGPLDALVDLMERFYRTSLLHEIKNVAVNRPVILGGPQQDQRRAQDLDINLTIEALVLAGAEKRDWLLPKPNRVAVVSDFLTAAGGGPAGFALVPWAVSDAGPVGPRRLAASHRLYASIAGKNVFFGSSQSEERDRPQESVDVTRYVKLTDITRNDRRVEANLYDQWSNRKTRLRTSAGFNAFRILNDEGEAVVQGTVVQIEGREVIFRVGEKYYTLHIGQSLKEVMDKPLKESEMRSLGLTKTAAKGE